MKKLVVSLAFVGLATLTFGQDAPKPTTPAAAPSVTWLGSTYKDAVVTFGGSLESGVAVVWDGSDAPRATLRGDTKVGGPGGRAELITNVDLGDAGAMLRLRADNWSILAPKIDASSYNNYSTSMPAIKSAFLWSNFYNKQLYVAVGALDAPKVSTSGDEAFGVFINNAQGLEVAVTPKDLVPGLVLDFFAGQSNRPLGGVGSLDNSWNLADILYGAAAGYSIDKFGSVKTGVQIASMPTTKAIESVFWGISASKLVPRLTVEVEGKTGPYTNGSGGFKDVQTSAPLGSISLGDFTSSHILSESDQNIKYNFIDMGLPMTVGLFAYERIPGTDSSVIDAKGQQRATSFKVNPSVNYNFDDVIIPKLGFSFSAGPEAQNLMVVQTFSSSMYGAAFTDPNGYNAKLTAAQQLNSINGTNGMALLQIKPEVKIQLNSKTNINVGYSYVQSVGSDDLVANKGPGVTGFNPTCKAVHSFEINFVTNW